MSPTISAPRLARLVGDFDRSPAYAGLAAALHRLISEGRLPHGTRLPSERELTGPLALSRTTVTRAYAELRERGYAEARRGSGTFTRVPGGPRRAPDRILTPRVPDGVDMIDLNCAAAPAPPGVATAYAAAVADLPGYLSDHGYYPMGLPELQAAIAATYDARGLPTEPEQVMVTPGALAATAIVAQACTAPGDRILVEVPGYPNAARALARPGIRIATTTVDDDGWDLPAVATALRRTRPRLAHLVPDFHNPTGNLMDDEQRAEYAAHVARTGAVALIDEAHQALTLAGQAMPLPFAAHVSRAGGQAITVGGASKTFWGGLRVGWIRAPHHLMDALAAARLTLDLGVPVLEQRAVLHLLADPAPTLADHLARLREQRDALVTAIGDQLPTWSFRVPRGGLGLWCRLPGAGAGAFTASAEAHGVSLAPGSLFAVDGGYDAYVRVPYARPADELREAVRRMAAAWDASPARSVARTSDKVMVA
ncbi:PLP-dependent aminotransferase family protein [Nocardioides sp. AE5]|uniref:MocR-like transcription factor YczR n=1 Tax=Nocardioides sp. AE5 TaxID=2962573 RepID=UPI002881F151|nr:PLP-dependent aminotransferase family protein [Nocardioides sp. AE5]MDT0202859.1 PLP-dependent aminotransferase family protein [Nocardioides sp. AE5]